jgi:phosphoribosyl 1,2-cyclic phosphodiesterase
VSLRFASLGSGSRGNATLIQSAGTLVLVDCGFPARELVRRCELLGVDPARIDAILVTHEHGDHIRGVGAVARKFRLPVWMTHGTYRAHDCGELPDLQLFGSHDGSFKLGDLTVTPVPVPHDAREPCQYTFAAAGARFGMVTDLGSLTPVLVAALDGLDALLLECNHDPVMLANGPYPASLQARVGGNYGHLSNLQAAQLLQSIDHERLRYLVAGHLSEKNNTPELARQALASVADFGARLSLLEQDSCGGWFDLR